MNGELSSVLSYLEKERGIDRETLFLTVESALLSASRKSVGPAKNVRIHMDRKTCDIKAFATVLVVEKVDNPHDEITLAGARKVNPTAQLGDSVEIEVTPKNFGRIAAQTAKQAILQKIRQAERNIVYEEYRDRVNDIVSGTIRRFERNDIVIDLGRAEAILSSKERISTEMYQLGDQIRALVLSVQDNASGPCIMLSRSHPDFLRRLFQLEVAEISDNTVEIKGVAREAGFRTKIAVMSRDAKVDPVGACVGMRGVRVKNIVRELSGEKIDIVRWSDDIKTYVSNALSPAKLSKVEIDPDKPRVIHVTTEADQLSLAIGKRGQNVRLSSKLTGWKIDVQKDEGNISFEEKVAKAICDLAAIPNIGRANAEKLVQAGFLNIEGILAAEVADLEATGEFDSATAKIIYEAAAAAQPAVQENNE
jgi:N utilization substance protein A